MLGEPLHVIHEFLEADVKPIAHRLDIDSESLRACFTAFQQTPALALQIPKEYGGHDVAATTFATYRILLAQYSGALSFLQAQHQVAVSRLLQCEEPTKRQQHLKAISAEQQTWGIGFIPPRRPAFSVSPAPDGFVLNGTIPWITGWTYLQQAVSAFLHEQHRYVFALPLQTIARNNSSITLSAPISVCVFNALNTVQATLDNWLVTTDDILYVEPVTDNTVSERHNSVYTLTGAAVALLQLVDTVPTLAPSLAQEKGRLQAQLDALHQTVVAPEDSSTQSPRALRIQASQLAERCAALARWVYGGRALVSDHPVNRLSREVWQYNIAGLSPDDLADVYLTAD